MIAIDRFATGYGPHPLSPDSMRRLICDLVWSPATRPEARALAELMLDRAIHALPNGETVWEQLRREREHAFWNGAWQMLINTVGGDESERECRAIRRRFARELRAAASTNRSAAP